MNVSLRLNMLLPHIQKPSEIGAAALDKLFDDSINSKMINYFVGLLAKLMTEWTRLYSQSTRTLARALSKDDRHGFINHNELEGLVPRVS